jgi:hypothetical protein
MLAFFLPNLSATIPEQNDPTAHPTENIATTNPSFCVVDESSAVPGTNLAMFIVSLKLSWWQNTP